MRHQTASTLVSEVTRRVVWELDRKKDLMNEINSERLYISKFVEKRWNLQNQGQWTSNRTNAQILQCIYSVIFLKQSNTET